MHPIFPEAANHRLVHLMTIARQSQDRGLDDAVLDELTNGSALLLVPAEPPEPNGQRTQKGLTFTYTATIDGTRTLFVFTGQAAIERFQTEDLWCVGVPSNHLLRLCLEQGIGAVVVDADTPNELCVSLD